MMEVEQIPPDLSAEDKRRYLFFKQINTLTLATSEDMLHSNYR